jgi:hypothetical protein
VIPHQALDRDPELTSDLPGRGPRTLLVDARRMRVEGDRPTLILLALSDGGDADV